VRARRRSSRRSATSCAPTAGEARVFGHPHDSLQARRLVGLAEQDVNLDRFLDVEETLVFHGGYYGMSRRDARSRAGR
jgi:ABC-2 type transport system ATP-binding protein